MIPLKRIPIEEANVVESVEQFTPGAIKRCDIPAIPPGRTRRVAQTDR